MLSAHSLLPANVAAQSGCALDVEICESDFPLGDILGYPDRAVAIIKAVVGASYRPLGATMICDGAGQTWGNLSSGCIERDVALHAAHALNSGEACEVLYGKGSPFKDLSLPCGGGLTIEILPRPDQAQLQAAAQSLAARKAYCLDFGDIKLTLRPQLRFLVFGKGPEATFFAQLAQAAGYFVESFSPEENAATKSIGARHLTHPHFPKDVGIDPRSAVVLFFHDHEWEPDILAAALRSPALYIGAQGSRRAAEARHLILRSMGFSPDDIARLAQPFGLIASVRDPRSLAVSVLAQVIDQSRR